MSERDQRHAAFEAKKARVQARKEELAPLITRVATLGETTYDALRPLATHVTEASREHPLRHQQVYGLGATGLSGQVADYLMVTFGDHHDLTLYQDFTGTEGTWQFKRSIRTADQSLSTDQTDLKERPLAYQVAHGKYDLEVSRYRYAERLGLNPRHDSFLCSYFDEYAEAESFLADMEADFTRAMEDFS